MLDIKTISKIKKMHFDQFYSVKYISRKLDLSKNTVYKYLKMSDFNTDVKFKKSNNLAAAEYKDIIVGWRKIGDTTLNNAILRLVFTQD